MVVRVRKHVSTSAKNKWLKEAFRVNQEFFPILLTIYLILLLWEMFWGSITPHINLSYLLLIVVISGIAVLLVLPALLREYGRGIAPFVLVSTCAISAGLIGSEILVLLIFLLTLGVYVWKKYDPRLPLAAALILLPACGVVGDEIVNRVATCAFYFLVVGVLGLFIDYLREREE